MATIDNVLDALNDQINTAIQNAGITNQGIIAPGWPNMPELTKQMEQVPAQYFVSIFPLDTEKRTTRFAPVTYLINAVEPQLTASVSGGQITFGGTVTAGVNATVVINSGTPGESYAATYQTVGTDTLATVASGVAAQVNALGVSGISASASGDVVTITGAASVMCNIGGTATTGTEIMRTERHFQLSVWCPDAPTRGAIAQAITNYFATVYFLQFPDTSYGRLKYVSAPWKDEMQRDTLYFAKMIYSVEWGVIQEVTQTQITAVQLTSQATQANGQNAPSITTTEG